MGLNVTAEDNGKRYLDTVITTTPMRLTWFAMLASPEQDINATLTILSILFKNATDKTIINLSSLSVLLLTQLH